MFIRLDNFSFNEQVILLKNTKLNISLLVNFCHRSRYKVIDKKVKIGKHEFDVLPFPSIDKGSMLTSSVKKVIPDVDINFAYLAKIDTYIPTKLK